MSEEATTDYTLAELCIVACADAWRGEGGKALLAVKSVPIAKEGKPPALALPRHEPIVDAAADAADPASDVDHPACPFPASGRSEVFHSAGCGNAGKISESNLVCYDSREAAIAAGKRSAGCCHP